jgi:hypothetical protein
MFEKIQPRALLDWNDMYVWPDGTLRHYQGGVKLLVPSPSFLVPGTLAQSSFTLPTSFPLPLRFNNTPPLGGGGEQEGEVV